MNKSKLNEELIKNSFTGEISKVVSSIHNGADIHYMDDEAIRISSCKGNIEIVKYLHQSGADFNIAYEWADESIKNELFLYKTFIEEKYAIQKSLEAYTMKKNKSLHKI